MGLEDFFFFSFWVGESSIHSVLIFISISVSVVKIDKY